MTVLEQEPSRWGHGRLALFGTFLILSLVFFLVNFSTDYDLHTPLYLNTTKGADWREWKSVQRMYVFGDSWSDTGFAINGTKPSLENPIGNPAWPGHTSANGSNWVGQLTSVYNQSVIMTTNYAMSGAMIDPDDNFPTWPHLQHEVRDNFVAAHNEHGAADTLIAIWIGVNNILFNTPSEGYAKDFETFTDLLDFLVRMGYDNFLLLNAPPLQRSPLSHKTDLDQQYAGRVDEWNTRLDEMIEDVGHRFDNTTILLFDVNKLMGEIMDDPGRFPQTKHVKIVEESCGAYMLGTPAPDSHDAHCEYSADKYLWLNDFHPSAALHDAVAAKVAEVLSGGG